MSLRELVDADCGGANALMRMGSHFARDHTHKDDGIGGASGAAAAMARQQQQQFGGGSGSADQMVNDFLGQVRAVPPQTFRMDALLQEMRDIDAQQFHAHLARAPPVIDEVHRGAVDWAREMQHQQQMGQPMLQQQQQPQQPPSVMDEMFRAAALGAGPGQSAPVWHPAQPPLATTAQGAMVCSQDFFDAKFGEQRVPPAADAVLRAQHDQFRGTEFSRYLTGLRDQQPMMMPMMGTMPTAVAEPGALLAKDFFDRQQAEPVAAESKVVEGGAESASDWAQDFEAGKQGEFEATQDYNSQFWNRLQNEWKKISDDEDTAHPWLSDFTDFYDPYKEYTFEADNPMIDLPDALARGRAFLEQGDLPSAILCFESAAKQAPDNATIWELLGHSQAENEKDPNAIAALKRSLDLQPGNAKVMMALAVSYTNESLQAQALSMLVGWLNTHEAYRSLIPPALLEQLNPAAGNQQNTEAAAAATSSMIRGPELKEVQDIFLQAVVQQQPAIDADIQEALGVLFNLSSEYDKAVDCFRAALHVRPDSAKTWNRLGASLANGNRSVEAVEAYQRALQLQPGFIRARYNVGIICINLKAYREATEHFLTALNHQATSLRRSGVTTMEGGGGRDEPGTQMSDTIWSTMRMAVSLLGRTDLIPALEKRDLTALNAEFGGAGAPAE